MNPQHLSQLGTRGVRLALFLSAVLALCVAGAVSGSMQEGAQGEREIEEKVAKHLPIKVKLKKPEKVKDSKNEEWVDDFELEVTNTGTKPIYYVYFSLSLPDVISDGKRLGFHMRYGRSRLVDLTESIQPDDVPILPGETVTLQIPENLRRAWKSSRAEGKWPNPKKLELRFQLLNHGDGTGFMTYEGVPLPNPQKVGTTCREGDGRVATAWSIFGSPPGRFPDIASFSPFLPSPVSLRPANFFSGASLAGAATNPDICCPGMGPNCARLRRSEQLCICGEVPAISPASCSDPFGSCVTTRDERIECFDSTGFKHFCDYIEIDRPCSSATPTPTPTPTPEPVPTPAPTPATTCDENEKPNDTNCTCIPASAGLPPLWNCRCDIGESGTAANYRTYPANGCPNGKYNNGNDCCTCVQIEPSCPAGYSWNEALCKCCNASGQCVDEVAGWGETEECPWCFSWQDCRTTGCSSPVLVDVNGDGFRLTDAAGGVLFDITGRNLPARLSWTAAGSDDAWLALDRNGNGRVDNGRELFGNFTAQPDPPAGEEHNGFLALAEFDKAAKGGNADGLVDTRDEVFARLRLWRDANHNGVSEPDELHAPARLGLRAFELDYKRSKRVDEHGNEFRYRAKVWDVRGAQAGRWAWDVYLVGAR